MSYINHKYKHIFVHIPKNAGSSMERLSYVGGSGHDTLHELINKKNKSYLHWGFVRNPYDKIVSLYHFWKTSGVDFFEQSDSYKKDIFEKFKSFILDYVANHTTNDLQKYLSNKKHFNVGVQPQHIFFKNDFIDLKDIKIGRFENIQEDFKEITNLISERSKIPIKAQPLAKINSTSRMDFNKYFDKESLSIVSQVYKKDFELFDYEIL